MNCAQSAPTKRESALVARYAFDVSVISGLGEEHLSEVSNLLRIHADRSQLIRLRREIDAILEDEQELERQVPSRGVLKSIDRLLPADWMIGGAGGVSDEVAQSQGDRRGPTGSLDKLTDQLQTLLGRVSERRRSPGSDARVE